jgi:hypothetical protein
MFSHPEFLDEHSSFRSEMLILRLRLLSNIALLKELGFFK